MRKCQRLARALAAEAGTVVEVGTWFVEYIANSSEHPTAEPACFSCRNRFREISYGARRGAAPAANGSDVAFAVLGAGLGLCLPAGGPAAPKTEQREREISSCLCGFLLKES